MPMILVNLAKWLCFVLGCVLLWRAICMDDTDRKIELWSGIGLLSAAAIIFLAINHYN